MTGKRRRSHGEWSVYEQRPGVWAAVVDLGWIDGKRCGRYVYAKTEADAIAKRDGLRRQLQLGVSLAAQSRTVATWLTESGLPTSKRTTARGRRPCAVTARW